MREQAAQGLLLAVIVGSTAACGVVDTGPLRPQSVGALEVWNRTERNVELVDQSGAVLEVPACANVKIAEFVLDRVEILSNGRYVATFGAALPDPRSPQPQYLVLTAAGGPFEPDSEAPAEPLPRCQGELPMAPE